MTASLSRNGGAAFGTVLVFVAVGPPLGALTLTLLLSLFVAATALMGHPVGLGNRLSAIVGMAPAAIALSFASGALQAAFTGLAVVTQTLVSQPPAWWMVSFYATVAWAGYMALGPSRDGGEMALLWPVHVLPALVCATLTTRLWKPKS